jgi:hypothetical protein
MALVNETLYDLPGSQPGSGASTPLDTDTDTDTESSRNTKRDFARVTDKPNKKKVPKGRKRVAYQKMLIGVINLALFAVFGANFDYRVILQDWWLTKSFLFR